MIKTEFRRIAEKHSGRFQYKDKDTATYQGVYSPNVFFKITCPYNNSEIKIINNTGYHYSGTISSKFKTVLHSLELNLTTRTHFSRVFSKSKSPFKIKVKNLNLKAFLEQSKSFEELEHIAATTKFEPFISGLYKDGLFVLNTKYHLQFQDWQQVLEPLIMFYKEFIDEFAQ